MKKNTIGILSLSGSDDMNSMGLIQRVEQTKEVLADCLRLSSNIRATMFGEGEWEDKKAESISNNVDSISYDCLSMVCNLRGELERTANKLDSRLKEAKKVANG